MPSISRVAEGEITLLFAILHSHSSHEGWAIHALAPRQLGFCTVKLTHKPFVCELRTQRVIHLRRHDNDGLPTVSSNSDGFARILNDGQEVCGIFQLAHGNTRSHISLQSMWPYCTTRLSLRGKACASTILPTIQLIDRHYPSDRVPNVGVRGRFPCRRKQEAAIAWNSNC